MAHHVFPPPDAASDVFHDDDASSGDAGLVARAQRGDGDAFATLFDRHAPRVYALAHRILGRDSEAEDVTQDAFLHALNALPTLRRGDAFRPWIMRIVTNLAWTTLRQRLRLPQAELTDAVVATHPDTGRWGSPEAMGLASEDQRAVRLTLDRLAPTHRAALAMREIGGLSYADIAASLGTTTSSVEVLLFRARARFRDEYRKVALGAGAPSVGAVTALRCDQTSRVLAVLADHEGSDEERRRAAAHARQCVRCAARLQGRTDSRTLLLALPLTVPATLKSAVLSRAAPLLVAHAATASAAGSVLTAGGGVSAGGAGAGVVAASGAAGGAGGTLAGASTSFVSIVGAGGLAAKIAALALLAASVAAVVVVTHAPARPTPRSSAHARRVTTAATPGSGAITAPSGRSSPVVQAVRPPVAATAVSSTTATVVSSTTATVISSTAARSPAALHRSPATPVTGRALARGAGGARGPRAVRTTGALRATPPPMSAFGARSGATGRATAAAHNARASATVTSNGGAAGTITPATRLAGGPTATTVTSRRSGARITPALATSGARGSGGVAGDAAGTATAAAPLAPPAARTPAASTVAATPVRAGSPLTTTPVPAARPAVSSSATPTAQSTGQGTTRRDATLTPRAAKPAITRAHTGRPARAGSRSVTAVPTTSRHAGRSTHGVAVRSPAPGRRSPRARPTRAAPRAVRPPPVTTRVATPSTGHGAAVVATLTALPGSAATTIAHTVASAPTVVATLIPIRVLPTITTVAPRVTPGVPPAVRATITVLPRPTRPGVPTVPPLATFTPVMPPLATFTPVMPPLPTLTPVVPPLPTVPVVTPPTPAPTVPAVLPSSSPTLAATIAVPTLAATIAVPTLAATIAVPTLAATIAVPTLAATIAVPTTATATLGLLPHAAPAVPVPPDGSNAPPMVPVVGISTLPVTTATPTTTATAPATATASATGSFTLLPALLISHYIGTVGVASRTLDVAGLHTIARGLGQRYRG